MKLIIFNGASCSGKSTIIKNILKQKEHYFHLSYDSLKWQFSQYASGKYYEDIHKVRISILRAVCELKYDVITEAVHKISRQKHIDIATEYGYEILEINLEADYEILSKRFDERVASASANPKSRMANFSKEKFQQTFETFQREKNPLAITFRTDTQSIEDITADVIKLLK